MNSVQNCLSFDSAGSMENSVTKDQSKLRESWQKFSELHVVGKHSIFWRVDVLNDGLGDLFSCLNAVHLVKQKYPEWAMKIFVLSHHKENPLIPYKEYGIDNEDLLIIRTMEDGERILLKGKTGGKTGFSDFAWKKEKCEYEQFVKNMPEFAARIDKFINFQKTADLHIDVSFLEYDYFFKGKKNSSKFMCFPEYGADKSEYLSEYSCANIFCMGLNPTSSGIFNLNPKMPESFCNSNLNQYFNQKVKVYFNYGLNLLGYTSLICRLNPEAKELNIITNFAINKLKMEDFEYIAKVPMIDKDGHQMIQTYSVSWIDRDGNEESRSQSSSGKMLRLINPFPLEHNDVLRSIALSEEPVGVTGNITFSESLDRLPFYNNRAPLQSFWNQLIQLTKSATPQNTKLLAYLEKMASAPKKNTDIHLAPWDLPILKKQWEELVNILRLDWDVKNAILGEINRRILEKKTSDDT